MHDLTASPHAGMTRLQRAVLDAMVADPARWWLVTDMRERVGSAGLSLGRVTYACMRLCAAGRVETIDAGGRDLYRPVVTHVSP